MVQNEQTIVVAYSRCLSILGTDERGGLCLGDAPYLLLAKAIVF